MTEDTFTQERPIRIKTLSEETSLPLSWWYAQTMKTGPDAVPRRKCGKYLLFFRSEVWPWLARRYGVNAGGEA